MKNLVISLCALLCVACSSGGNSEKPGGSGKSQTDIDINGEWTLRSILLESTCSGFVDNTLNYIEIVNIEQNDNSILMSFESGVETEAELSGNDFTNISLTSYPIEIGTLTETALQFSVNNEGTIIDGVLEWNWDTPDESCSGKDALQIRHVNLPSELDGSWRGVCDSLNLDFPASAWFIDTYNGGHYEYTVEGFDNDNCDGAPLVTRRGMGYVFHGDQVTIASGMDTATELEIKVVSVEIQGPSGAIADSLYGFEAGEIYYDLYYLDGNTLYYSIWPPTDPLAFRSDDIDFSIPYTRVE